MSGLEHLLDKSDSEAAWNHIDEFLIVEGPNVVSLLIDMAAALNRALGMLENDRGGDHQDRVLLDRFADLDQKAGTA